MKITYYLRTLLLLLGTFLWLLPAVAWSTDIFLKIEGVDGESTDASHPGEIEVISFTEQLQSSNVAGGGGKASFSDVVVTKFIDKTSPQLRLSAADGSVFTSATISVRDDSSDSPIDFFVVQLSNVKITSASTAVSSSSGRPVESVTLNFGSISWTYTPIDSSGVAGEAITTGWDVLANTEL